MVGEGGKGEKEGKGLVGLVVFARVGGLWGGGELFRGIIFPIHIAESRVLKYFQSKYSRKKG